MILRQEVFMISMHWLRSLILVLVVSSAAFTQTPPASSQTDEQRKAQQELQGKALSLLEDVIKDSEAFKHAENRIRLRMLSANLLWPHDEARARILLKEAMESLVDLINNQEAGEASDTSRAFGGVRQLREEFLQMLARRDPRLAREFLRASRPQSSQPGNPREMLPDQPLEMTLATQIAASDPKQALEIAEENLSRGLSYELPQFLSTLREKDPEGAARLASQLMTKIRAEKLEASHMARQVAVSLLREAALTSDGEAKGGKNAPPLLDQQTLRELTEMIAMEALRPSSTSPELLDSLREMMPIVEKYAPARAAQLRRRTEPPRVAEDKTSDEKPTDNDESYPATIEENRFQAIFEKGSVDELLAEAPNAPEGMREMLYQRATVKLMEAGDAERARQIINERVKHPVQRKQMLDQLDEIAAYKAAEQGNIEKTRKMLATLRTNEERVIMLAQLATGAAAKGEKKTALQLLDEARGMMGGRAKNFKQLGAQLMVARAYAPLDASRSLAILEPVVDQLNELLAAAIVLGGFMTEEIVQDDEIMMSPLAMISNELAASDYLSDVHTLARADFERTKALADRFLRDEIRISARLLLAQSILLPQVRQDAIVTSVDTIKP
jgi:hypothetical protein